MGVKFKCEKTSYKSDNKLVTNGPRPNYCPIDPIGPTAIWRPHQAPSSGPAGQGGPQNGQNVINLQGIMSDVQNMLSQLQTQNPGIQMNFNGMFPQPGQAGGR